MKKNHKNILSIIVSERHHKTFYHHGIKCEINRSFMTGSFCGYVHLGNKYKVPSDLFVHGGITYEEDGTFGFDCAHTNDLKPLLPSHYPRFLDVIYRDYNFAINETKRLADQVYFYNRRFKKLKKLKK